MTPALEAHLATSDRWANPRTTAPNPVSDLLANADRQRAASEAEARKAYAALVARAADGKLAKGDTVEAIEELLFGLGKVREDLDHDVEALRESRDNRRRTGNLLDIMRSHRDAERAAQRAQGEYERGKAELIARFKATVDAEKTARWARQGPAVSAHEILRLVPDGLRSAFLRAEQALMLAEDVVEATTRLGAPAGELAALEADRARAEKAARAAWEAVLAHDPAPRSERPLVDPTALAPVEGPSYSVRPAAFDGVQFAWHAL